MRELVSRRRQPLSEWLPDIAGLGGAVSGFLAGMVMIIVSPVLALMTGIGMWEPPKLIAATVLDAVAVQAPGFALTPVLIGAVLHLLISTLLGYAFGLVYHRVLHLTTDFGTPLLIGLCYGLLIFFVAYAVVLPVANPLVRDSFLAPIIAQNIVFGVCIGGFYTLLRPKPYEVT